MGHSQSNLSQEFTIRLVLLGDVTVGKTSLVERYIFQSFDPTYKYSSEPESHMKTIRVGNMTVNLDIIDIGAHRFGENLRAIILPFLQISHGVLLVCDVSKNSNTSLVHWLQLCQEQDLPYFYKVIIGNKSDLRGGSSNCDVSKMEEIASASGIPVYVTSAKTGSNVNDVFEHLLTAILKDLKTK